MFLYPFQWNDSETQGSRIHVKMYNNLTDASHLQQKSKAWFFAVFLTFPFPSNSHSYCFHHSPSRFPVNSLRTRALLATRLLKETHFSYKNVWSLLELSRACILSSANWASSTLSLWPPHSKTKVILEWESWRFTLYHWLLLPLNSLSCIHPFSVSLSVSVFS